MQLFIREKYLKTIRPFYNSDIIKVITGIRRCGKSCIMKTIINELNNNGIDDSQIIYIPLDMRGFKNIDTPEKLENKIEECININNYEFYYLLIDEVQNVKEFEKVVQAYQEEGFSIFITGSNSYLLSDEISTKLTGRYINFEIYTLDFKEYIDMKSFY
ncbi:MAG: AAA family ATPase, partial [Erysipelotrichaceae bacterium]|nr:AAA family ATPase [Erysipelotrichaceae bacterium]